ncbi:MAG: polymer-forming cytoskeletal protein [Pseudomonadales bacterium]
MLRKKGHDAITLVAANTEIVGDMNFSGELFVYGEVNGNVVGKDDNACLTLSESGIIRGEVRVTNVIVNGRIEGDIFAKGKVELAAKANLHGNVYYRLIEMQLGARVEGQLLHTDDLPANEPVILALPERRADKNERSASET